MNFEGLRDNLVSVIKEAQIKLGWERMPIGVNYVRSSLLRLLGDDVDEKGLSEALEGFCDFCRSSLGEIEIAPAEDGFRITVSADFAERVHDMTGEDEFLVELINEIRSPLATIESVEAIFRRHGDDAVIRSVDNDEFDYVMYFEGAEPDAFIYCIDTADLGITYHRFTKEDYLDLGFSL